MSGSPPPSRADERNQPRKPWEDRWLVEAFKRLGHPAVERLRTADSAWEALEAAGVAPEQLVETACAIARVPAADLTQVGKEQARLADRLLALRYRIVPLGVANGRLEVATANPLSPHLDQDLEFALGRRVALRIANPTAIRQALERLYPPEAEGGASLARLAWILTDRQSGAVSATVGGSAVETLDALLVDALDQRASDVHLEPRDDGLLVRFRLDGVLHDDRVLPGEVTAHLISRLKVMAGLDIADRLRPQDGRASMTFDGRPVDLRISTLPLGRSGEKAVVRLLDSATASVGLGALGFSEQERTRIERLLKLPEGLVLVTGPTGSGKTTTLYSTLYWVRAEGRNVVTVEDPVEYRLQGINQVQVHERSGLTFAAALRSILRQDPDVVLVGEIRDAETASIAIKASMTGHRVLSTLHTNDAPSAVSRMLDIGADRVALASALKGVMAQRLVRKLCPDCSRPATLAELPVEQQALLMGKDCSNLRLEVGCAACRHSGYRGRTVVAEILVAGPELQQAMARGADMGELAALARRGGMKSLWESGIEKVLTGTTSLHELVDNVAAPSEGGAAAPQSDIDKLLAELVPGRAKGASGASPPAQAARGPAGARVLIVDEDRDERRRLREALQREGYRVLEATDGEVALGYARRLKPDAIITEFALPKLDAIGLLQALGTASGMEPVVMLYTQETDEALHQWARELGACDVVQKPGDVASVLKGMLAARG
jgi:type II secretory ATPase GspE/PulE/Tfp pilus assembly ATPase PilB-like protein/CheY-like chemotaxis protein